MTKNTLPLAIADLGQPKLLIEGLKMPSTLVEWPLRKKRLETVGADECEKLHTGILLSQATGMDARRGAAAAPFCLNSRTFFPHTV